MNDILLSEKYLVSSHWYRAMADELQRIKRGLEESRRGLFTLGKTPESNPEMFGRIDRVSGACDVAVAHLHLTKLGLDFEESIAGISGREIKDIKCPKCGFEWAENHPRFCMVDITCPFCGKEKEAELW